MCKICFQISDMDTNIFLSIHKSFLVNSIGHCVDDAFGISSPGTFGSPIICGTNTGYHSTYLFWIMHPNIYLVGFDI